jgi:hypothetical protein
MADPFTGRLHKGSAFHACLTSLRVILSPPAIPRNNRDLALNRIAGIAPTIDRRVSPCW